MTAATNPRAVLGGNNPPPLSEILQEKYEGLSGSVADLALSAEAAPREIKTDGDLDRTAVVVKDAKQMLKRIDGFRVAEKEPFLQSGRDVDSFFKLLSERVNRIADVLSRRADDYNRKKLAEARRRAEEEARKAREEAEAARKKAAELEAAGRAAQAAKQADKAEAAIDAAFAAEAKGNQSAADLTRVRGESGVLASTCTEWKGEIVNIDELDVKALAPFIKREHLQSALNAFVRTGRRELKGARIFEDVKSSFR